MPPGHDDRWSVLCERCGYRVDGLPDAGHCPECGLAIRESLPEVRRRGSAWQQRRLVAAWLATGWAVLTAPGRTFGGVRIGARTADLLAINIALAGLPAYAAIAWAGLAVDSSAWLSPAAAGLLAVAWLLPALTWIESLGLRYFGGRRRWRITREVAAAVCAHASYAWVLAGLLAAGGYLAGLYNVEQPIAYWLDRRLAPALGPGTVLSLRPWRGTAALALGAVAGMLVFETYVYIGVRRCRFANRVRGG